MKHNREYEGGLTVALMHDGSIELKVVNPEEPHTFVLVGMTPDSARRLAAKLTMLAGAVK